jgi:small conductance mechanosensitive channel
MKETLLAIWEKYHLNIIELIRDIVTAVIIVIAGKTAIKLTARLLDHSAAGRISFDETAVSVLKIIIRYAIIIICFMMILNAFGVNTASLLAVLGAAGVAVGLALKDTMSNIAAGIILLFLRSFGKGDYIEFGGTSGTVKEISLFTTTLETPDGIFISAPNSTIWGVPLKNYSRNGKRRMDLSVGISYGDSIDDAFKVLNEIIAAEPRFLKTPAPQVLVSSLGDSAVNIVLRAWASGGDYWDAYWFQTKNIKEKIEAAGLSIPYPQRDVHLLLPKDGTEA